VGVGIVCDGKVIHGLQHPEGGHIRVSKHENDNFKGICPIHQNCLEGYITNNAIKERKNLNSVELCTEVLDSDEIWDYISYYIAQQCLNLLYLLSIEKIIIGGGVINREILLGKVRENFIKLNNNYIDNPILKEEKIHEYIDRTGFKNYSGIISAFSLSLLE
jgi:fructokinase